MIHVENDYAFRKSNTKEILQLLYNKDPIYYNNHFHTKVISFKLNPYLLDV